MLFLIGLRMNFLLIKIQFMELEGIALQHLNILIHHFSLLRCKIFKLSCLQLYSDSYCSPSFELAVQKNTEIQELVRRAAADVGNFLSEISGKVAHCDLTLLAVCYVVKQRLMLYQFFT